MVTIVNFFSSKSIEDDYKNKFLSLIDECDEENILHIAIIIADYWNTHSTPAMKNRSIYKCEIFRGSLGTLFNLDNMPQELRGRLYAYMEYVFN